MIGRLINFCDEWGEQSARLGWDDVSLFGVDPDAPHPDRQRRDRHGIAIQLACSVLPNIWLVDLDRKKAIFATSTGSQLVATRYHPARDNAKPIWEVAK